MNKKVLLLGLLLPFAFSSSFAQKNCDKDCLTKAVLKAASTSKLVAMPSMDFLGKNAEALIEKHPNAHRIINMGKIYQNEVKSVSLPNETFTIYLFLVLEENTVHSYLSTEYKRQTWDQSQFNGAEFLRTDKISDSQSVELYVSLLSTKIAQLQTELEFFSMSTNYLSVLLGSSKDILEIKRIVNVHKNRTYVLEDPDKQEYTGYVEIELVNGKIEKKDFTCIPAGSALDEEHTITNDDFPVYVLTPMWK